jgi:hypothetical protein
MLVRGIEFALEEGLEEIERIYKFRADDEYFTNFIESNDETISHSIIEQSNGWAGEYFKRIERRKIFKEVFQVEIKAQYFDDSILLSNANNPSENKIKRINGIVADFLKMERQFVIVDFQNISNPTFKQQQVEIDANDIMTIDNKSGNRIKFTAVSTIFHNPSIEPKKGMIYIYAPMDELDTREEREKFISGHRDNIFELIKEELKRG